MAKSRALREERTAAATPPCSISLLWKKRPASSMPWTRVASATAARRLPGCFLFSKMRISVEKPGTVKLAALPPLALYVHIPWCVRKCPYCDFNSHERTGELPEVEYIEKLLVDLESLLPSVWGRRLTSVFIGRRTPSLFSPESIDRLLSGIRARPPLQPAAEVTLGANPRP